MKSLRYSIATLLLALAATFQASAQSTYNVSDPQMAEAMMKAYN